LDEYQDLLRRIQDYLEILTVPERLDGGDPRRVSRLARPNTAMPVAP